MASNGPQKATLCAREGFDGPTIDGADCDRCGCPLSQGDDVFLETGQSRHFETSIMGYTFEVEAVTPAGMYCSRRCHASFVDGG